MAEKAVLKTTSQPKGAIGAQTARRRFVPALREPIHLNESKLELPLPGMLPAAPGKMNLLTTILPPALMLIASLLVPILTKNLSTLIGLVPMFMMSLGFPVANIISLKSQKKEYRQAIEKREQDYRKKLAEETEKANALVRQQQQMLQEIYPPLAELERIAAQRGNLLWARRPTDDDFLSMRIGRGAGSPSFKVEPPRYSDPNDKLPPMAVELAAKYQLIPNLPAMLPLGVVGSMVISGRSLMAVVEAAWRMMIDALVHHSPQDLQVAVLGDTREALERWEWLKWLPHTDALGADKRQFLLAFDLHKIEQTLEMLAAEAQSRVKAGADFVAGKPKRTNKPAIIVLVDDSGVVRQQPVIQQLAEWGYEARIHLVFIGGREVPRECRSRLEVNEGRKFKYTETWTKSGIITEGEYEPAVAADCERIARALAGLEAASNQSRVPLPEKVRLSQVLGVENMTVEAVKQSWSADIQPKDMLQFPIGICAQREQLDLAMINLLPAERGGDDAYHSILIGTTGSGKSEFMKSLVMAAALRYPPNLLNFFFLDFKGGAAFSVFEELPHVSGVVTNLSPELVERGLDSIRNEIERRQEDFSHYRVTNIWDYNREHPQQPLPHLVLLLDEFARGLADFPRLRETLDVLVRQGRSLGMYLILANQDVNSEVDKLLNNIGWRMALKVAKSDELNMIDRTLPNATRAGQGYLRSLNGEITEFQAGYGGLPMQSGAAEQTEGFTIFQVEADGSFKPFYRQTLGEQVADTQRDKPILKEEACIISTLKQASADLRIKPAPRIYLDPLAEAIALETTMEEAGISPAFANGEWQADEAERSLVACWGEMDIPQQCLQETLRTDFRDRDGHLWMIGAQGSGKDMALNSLLLSLALRYTPEQAQLYLLELGSGELAVMENLPHTGALIRPLMQEKERFIRLLDFLETEMDRRSSLVVQAEHDGEASAAGEAALFVVINNFAELRANFPDETDRFNRVVRDGKPVGIHLIITTNRGGELLRNISNNISRRLVLQLGSRDEYMDIIGRQVAPLAGNIAGRGYWVDGDVHECQVAQPPQKMRELIRQMNTAWTGKRPQPIETLAGCIPYAAFKEELLDLCPEGQVLVPVGRSYDTLELIAPNLLDASNCWLILGPRESGKSNFLACAATAVLEQQPDEWDIRAYAPRRSPLISLGKAEPRVRVLGSQEEIIKDCTALSEAFKAGQSATPGKRLLLLVDDLGFSFQPNREPLLLALNTLAQNLEGVMDVTIFASGLLDELRMQMASPFLKLIRQGRTGLALSKDTNELDWLGANLSLEYRRMDLPVGRGFFVNRGKAAVLVQVPLLGECG